METKEILTTITNTVTKQFARKIGRRLKAGEGSLKQTEQGESWVFPIYVKKGLFSKDRFFELLYLFENIDEKNTSAFEYTGARIVAHDSSVKEAGNELKDIIAACVDEHKEELRADINFARLQ